MYAAKTEFLVDNILFEMFKSNELYKKYKSMP